MSDEAERKLNDAIQSLSEYIALDPCDWCKVKGMEFQTMIRELIRARPHATKLKGVTDTLRQGNIQKALSELQKMADFGKAVVAPPPAVAEVAPVSRGTPFEGEINPKLFDGEGGFMRWRDKDQPRLLRFRARKD